MRDCDCPETDGVIRHQRATCTDPVVAQLDWYADDHDREGGPSGGPSFSSSI